MPRRIELNSPTTTEETLSNGQTGTTGYLSWQSDGHSTQAIELLLLLKVEAATVAAAQQQDLPVQSLGEGSSKETVRP